jgi:hypothetical protein
VCEKGGELFLTSQQQQQQSTMTTTTTQEKDVVMWVTPQQTRKTRQDAIEEFSCKPCLKAILKGSCGTQMLNLLACVYISQHSTPTDCLEDYKQMTSCWRAHAEEYAEFLKDPNTALEKSAQM